jgi:hypothetical protein
VLLLIDLDNTLIDRSAAFRAWATDYVPQHGDDPSDLDWLIEADRDGYEPRPRLAEKIAARHGLSPHRVISEGAGIAAATGRRAWPHPPTWPTTFRTRSAC